MQVWWLPSGELDADFLGCFVIRDGTAPFHPPEHRPLDFGDLAVRLRGRGLGTEIMHRALAAVSYHPGTRRGNITLLTLGRQDRVPAAVENRS